MIRRRSFTFYVKLFWANLCVLARMAWVIPYASIRRRKRAGTKSGEKTGQKRVLFFFSQVPWHEVWQRPQEIASRFCDYGDVIYFSPVQAHRRLDTLRTWQRKAVHKTQPHRLTVLSPLILSAHYKSRLIFKLNAALILAEARAALSEYDDVVFLTNSPFAPFLVEQLDYQTLVYDVIDEFVAFGWAPPNGRDMEHRLLKRADLVLTGTYTLLEKKRSERPRVHYVGCGVRFDLFNRPDATEMPEDLKKVKKPIFGYTGSISERLDGELIAELAGTYPEASVVLIGPIHGDMRAYPSAPNIVYLGLKRHEELPRYVHQFDVALIPFKLNEASLAVNPVKTLEYLAAGKPVLSTAIPDVERFYGDCVAVARSHEEFIRLADSLLKEDNSQRIRRGIEHAREHSWETMIRTMQELISAAQDKQGRQRAQ